MKKNIFTLIISLLSIGINAQSVTINPANGTTLIDAQSSTQGFLMPRMTVAERTAILSPAVGLQVYQTDGVTGIYFYSISGWQLLNVNNTWQYNGHDIYNLNTGNVGIGTNSPIAPLNIFNAMGASTLYQTTNTGILSTDGFLAGIANTDLSAYLLNYENGPLNLGTNSVTRLKIEANGNIGIGTSNPALAALHVESKAVLFSGLSNLFGISIPPPPVSGQGSRTFWYPEKGAFRTGAVSNNNIFGFPDADVSNFNNWDKDSIGVFSFAAGFNTKAKGDFSVAIGNKAFALGNSSSAFGGKTLSKGDFSFTAGYGNKATGEAAVAFGYNSTASGNNSLAFGEYAVSSGLDAFASGANTEASGIFSTAMGNSTIASGKNSTAMGKNANTNLHENSFCLSGITSNSQTNNTADNQMMMRFDNYTFYLGATGNYVYLLPASNGWTYVSDRNKKENFLELNGETVLKKISNIPFYSWNFKAKETKTYRHYGIMAQDFHESFGKDELGVIGNDTTVSTLDLLGVAYSAIKALEKRTEDLQLKNQQLIDTLQAQSQKFNNEIAELKAMIQPKRKRIAFN